MKPWRDILECIGRDGRAALVTVAKVEGSTPREMGARMIVRHDGTIAGSIGGGPLEWNAIDLAKEMLNEGRKSEWRSVPLGPEIDQCCGGRAEILHETFDRTDLGWITLLADCTGPFATEATRNGHAPLVRKVVTGKPDHPFSEYAGGRIVERFGHETTRVYIFGAGHVGRALVKALAGLPFDLRWIDSRPDAFAGGESGLVSALPEAELRSAPEHSFVLVMTHSHALDLAIVTAALNDGRFAYVGLIGSATKRALFERRLAEFGVNPERIQSLVCPIGVPGISGKSPPEIAAAVAAELLQVRERMLQNAGRKTEIAVG